MSAFYVSATGNDTSGNGSEQDPFGTLARAQAAMEQSSTKTTYVEAGTYTLNAAVSLTASDDGETFSSAPGQDAVITGGSSLATLVNVDGASGVTLSGLTFENSGATSGLDTGAVSLSNASDVSITGDTFDNSGSDALLMVGSTDNTISDNQILNSAANGIEDQDGGSGNTFANNTINGVGAQNTSGGAFYLHGTTGETISNNLVENTQGSGIDIVSIGGYDGNTLYARNTYTVIQNNLVLNTSLDSTDAGGIYVLDRTGQDTNITIDNNEVSGSGNGSYIGGIYLDDYTSGVTVTNNIVRDVSQRDFQLHGGKDDTISNNIFDLSNVTAFAVLFQADSGVTPNSGPQAATNDSFTSNIIVSRQANPTAYIDAELSPNPSVSDNLYYDPNGTFSTGLDTSPVIGNPDFVDAVAGNYGLQSGSAATKIGFVAINQALIGPAGSALPTAPAPVSVGTGPDAIVLSMSEDAYLGDAQFTVSVNGQQIGGTLTTTALADEGQSQLFTLNGNFGTGALSIAVDFTNDAYGGSAATDRNLYVNSIQANGTTTVENALQATSGTQTYQLPAAVGSGTTTTPAPVTVRTGPNAIVLSMSEDAYLGDAQFTVSVNGQQIGGTLTTTALKDEGQSQLFTLNGSFGTGALMIAVDFTNDAYGGSATTDRNLYVNSIQANGTTTVENAFQASSGTEIYQVAAAAVTSKPTAPAPVTVGTGPNAVVLSVSEDAYLGDAQFTVSVNGQQVGGTLTTTALEDEGQSQLFTLNGNFGTGALSIAVDFTNDAYGGSATTDRNLYVNSIQANGTTTVENALQASSGTQTYHVPAASAGGSTGSTPPPPETLSGTGATNTLTGNGGNDTYLIGGGDVFDTVINSAPTMTFVQGQLDMDAPAANIWFDKSNEDLVIGILGGHQEVLVQNWFLQPSAQLSEIRSTDGLFLDTGLQSLMQSMSQYEAAHPGFTVAGAGQNISALPGNSGLMSAFQAAWHTALA